MFPPYIIANWKMNPKSEDEAKRLIRDTLPAIKREKARVIFLAPFVWLSSLNKVSEENPGLFDIGAQNSFWKESGAYTGEISPIMLKNSGCSYVLVGHSERELYLNEDKKMIKEKLKTILAADLIPIFCLHSDSQEDLKQDLNLFLESIDEKEINKIIYVYEPTGAISTQGGKTPSREEISLFKKIFNEVLGEKISLIYGGSVNSDNVKSLTTEIGLNGALVGAKSLDATEFSNIIHCFD